jgi:serpin B
VAILVNAIFLSDNWLDPFQIESTTAGVFHSPGGDVEADLMRSSDPLPYYEDEALQAAHLPLRGPAGLWVLLPKTGDAATLLESLDGERFRGIARAAETRSGELVLPRLDIGGGSIELGPVLEGLGVNLFDPALAALTGGLVEGEGPVYLSKAVHKATLEVDENGLTAAAATAMIAVARAMLPSGEPFELILDRPFVVVISGRAGDNPAQVLFVGVVNRPKEDAAPAAPAQ